MIRRIRRVVIWGAGGHALAVADAVRRRGWYDLIGFLDDVSPERRGEEFAASVILGGREQIPLLCELGVGSVLVAVGDNEDRVRLAADACLAGFALASVCHPAASTPQGFMMGGGTVIMPGAIIQPGTSIGENVIINTGATVDHGCAIDDGVHIAPGAHLGGNVKVYRGAFVGMGAVVVPGVTIDPGAVVGAGSVVLADVPHSTVVYGNPARVIRTVRPGDFARLSQ